MLELLGMGYLTGKLMDKVLDKSLDTGMDTFLNRKKEARRIQEIYNAINKFNVNFANTEIDTNNFQNYLNQPEIQELFFNHTFNHREQAISNEELVELLVDDALKTMNDINHSNKWPIISNKDLLINYFETTLKHLIRIRDSILTESEKTQLVLIQQYILEAKKEIVSKLDKLINENNTYSIRLEIDSKIEGLRNLKHHSKTNDYEAIIRYLDVSIGKYMEKLDEDSEKEPVEKFVYSMFYDACLDTESENKEWLSLGLDVQFYTAFEELLLFLNRIKNKLSNEDLQSYLNVLMTLVNTDEWKLFVYLNVYLDNEKILLFIDEHLIQTYPIFGPPLDMRRERGFWNYIIENLGKLDPYPICKIIEELAGKNDTRS